MRYLFEYGKKNGHGNMAPKSVKRYIGGDEAGAGVWNKKKLSSAVPGAEYQDKVRSKGYYHIKFG